MRNPSKSRGSTKYDLVHTYGTPSEEQAGKCGHDADLYMHNILDFEASGERVVKVIGGHFTAFARNDKVNAGCIDKFTSGVQGNNE